MVRSNIAVCIEGVEAEEVVAERREKSEARNDYFSVVDRNRIFSH